MNPVTYSIEAMGLTGAWTYLILFLGFSLILIWRFEALLDHGLEGTALGTLVMPYCSGLANLMLVAIILRGGHSPSEIVANGLVNNLTNLTLILGLVALLARLSLRPPNRGKKSKRQSGAAELAQQLNLLSLQLTLAAGLFFTGILWALGGDGVLNQRDGWVLIALFLFWQCFQVYDVMKHNVRRRMRFGMFFYVDLAIIAVGAYGLYASTEWLVDWLAARPTGLFSAEHLGWITGWLMVLPNALLALYYARRERSDVVYASQIGDGHICIPLGIGLTASLQSIEVPANFSFGLALLAGGFVAHMLCLQFIRGLPRWVALGLLGAYTWFVAMGY